MDEETRLNSAYDIDMPLPAASSVKKPPPFPSFDLSAPLNVTIQYGGHVYLVCRVQDVGNKSVCWPKMHAHITISNGHEFSCSLTYLHRPRLDQVTHRFTRRSLNIHEICPRLIK